MYQTPALQPSTLGALLDSESIVPGQGALRLLYQQAQYNNYEYASSAFWQIWLQTMFAEDEWIVVCEFPPDRSLRRVDVVVRYYDPDHHTLSSCVYVEAKKPDGDPRQVEAQALSAAQLAVRADNTTGVYVITTIGTRFASWYYARGSRELTLVDPTKYIDAGSPEARCLIETVRTIKNSRPLRVAPVLPSQPLPTFEAVNTQDQQTLAQDALPYQQAGVPEAYGQESVSVHHDPMDHDQQAYDWQHYGQENPDQQDSAAGPSAQDPWAAQDTMPYQQAGASGMYGQETVSTHEPMDHGQRAHGQRYYDQGGHGQQDTVAGPSGTAFPTAAQESGNVTAPIEYIKVAVEKKTLQNQYKFRDAGGRTRVTRKEEWVKTEYKGKPAWVYRGNRKTYYTRNKVE